MSLQQAKNALVASLFELSNAATNAAAATVDFYRQADLEGAESVGSLLKDLSSSISGAAGSVALTLNNLINGSTATPRKKVAKRAIEASERTYKSSAYDSSQSAHEVNGTAELNAEDDEGKKNEGNEKAEKPKKRRVEKDPNAPKKPLTSYLRFNLQIRDSLRKERAENGQPTFPATELNKIIAEKWANLTNVDKTSLQQEYDKEFEKYKEALEKYKAEKLSDQGLIKADAHASNESTSASKAPTTPKKKAAVTPRTTNEFTEGSLIEARADAKAQKKKKAKVALDTPSSDPAAPGDEAKKSKKRKEKESEEKKLKKKKSE